MLVLSTSLHAVWYQEHLPLMGSCELYGAACRATLVPIATLCTSAHAKSQVVFFVYMYLFHSPSTCRAFSNYMSWSGQAWSQVYGAPLVAKSQQDRIAHARSIPYFKYCKFNLHVFVLPLFSLAYRLP